jgi:hypothetical protein
MRPGEPDPKQERAAAILTRWLTLLKKVRKIQRSIRNPEWVPADPEHPIFVYYASRVLRYMAYVGRVQTESQRYIGKDAGGGEVYYHFGLHHGWMAAGFWLAQNQREIRSALREHFAGVVAEAVLDRWVGARGKQQADSLGMAIHARLMQR